MDYETCITKLTVLPKGQPLFSEQATSIEIEDEAAGEFVVVSQDHDGDEKKIQITPEEWPYVRDAIEKLIANCKERK